MRADRNLQAGCLAKCLKRNFRVHDALSILGNRRRSRVDHPTDIRQLFSLLSFRDRADLHHVNRRKGRCLKPDIIYLVRHVDHGSCVRHGADRSIPAAGRRFRSCTDVFLVGQARIPQMDVKIDQPRHDPASGRIDLHRVIRGNVPSAADSHHHLPPVRSGKRQVISDPRDLSVLDQNIRYPVCIRFRIQ